MVIAQTAISLDGFVAGPNHEMDWVFEHQLPPDAGIVEDAIANFGAILTGRNSYDVGRRSERAETSGAYGGRWQGPEFVLTHDPPDDDPSTTFLSGDIAAAVARAREAAGGRSVLVLGATVAREVLYAGLLDELHLLVLPVLLGDGIALFERGPRVDLETIEIKPLGAATSLRYRVRR
jgi:dihydrofolate reductase